MMCRNPSFTESPLWRVTVLSPHRWVTVHSPRPLAGEGLGVRVVDSTTDPLTLTPVSYTHLDVYKRQGFDRATVERIARLVIVNEYKRRQAAPGVRITPRAFGRDRRYPITSGFRR